MRSECVLSLTRLACPAGSDAVYRCQLRGQRTTMFCAMCPPTAILLRPLYCPIVALAGPCKVQGDKTRHTLEELSPAVQHFVTRHLIPLYAGRGDDYVCTPEIPAERLRLQCYAPAGIWATMLVPKWKAAAPPEACSPNSVHCMASPTHPHSTSSCFLR